MIRRDQYICRFCEEKCYSRQKICRGCESGRNNKGRRRKVCWGCKEVFHPMRRNALFCNSNCNAKYRRKGLTKLGVKHYIYLFDKRLIPTIRYRVSVDHNENVYEQLTCE